ncbi:2'-5' RNA ligase family protein [Methanoregula sp.]|uniref:2'-5' RNA ligase family protein n=1 Tax=Methanoregula sp. TaxID=2052170 RepID=UPI002C72AA4F|nr:2'-5' RNA ligase family protein [Methanoregula sp.]HVP96003.1 2'-5' RNA ligase family protein [Methanoregula sp.]
MSDTYLVEIRLARTRWRIKETTRAIARKFKIEQYREHHPHITLFGPFSLDDPCREQDLLDTVAACAPRGGAIPFTLQGWESREGMHGGVVAFSIRPSLSLLILTETLSKALSGFTISLNAWDLYPDKKWFHVTIANRLPPKKSGEIISGLAALPLKDHGGSLPNFFPAAFRNGWDRLRRFIRGHHDHPIRPILLDDAGLRITVMKNTEILGEYDLLMQRWLTPEEIRAPGVWQESMTRYRRAEGFELAGPVPHDPGQAFLISDLHLGHANIIRYCSRPFVPSDVAEMDRVLIANWNCCISGDDKVYFLGDLRYGKQARPETEYKTLLNGNITFLAGNHDRSKETTITSATLTWDGMEFLLVHDPANAPAGYSGWIIHGHHHNNDLRAFPFMDPVRKRINVSIEVIGYCPVSLQEICQTLKTSVIPSGESLLLRYPCLPLDTPDTSN